MKRGGRKWMPDSSTFSSQILQPDGQRKLPPGQLEAATRLQLPGGGGEEHACAHSPEHLAHFFSPQHANDVDWCGCSPNDYVGGDRRRLERLVSMPRFFARKFDPVSSLRIISTVWGRGEG